MSRPFAILLLLVVGYVLVEANANKNGKSAVQSATESPVVDNEPTEPGIYIRREEIY